MLDEQDVATWTLTRDYSKCLTTKMYYIKDNSLLHANPAIHAQAILDGIRSEHSSKLLEDLMSIRRDQILGGAEIDLS